MNATPDLSREKSGKHEHVEQLADEPSVKGVEEQVDKFGAHEKTDPVEIKLVRKLDLYMMPILWLMYFFNFLDRNAMINGKLDGLDKDLHMKGYEYNTCVSILFVGYLAGQIPSNMLLNRIRPSIFMATFMTAWSITTLCTYMVHDYKTMLVARLILGIVESPFYPGALYMLSMFYTRKEIATRMSIFYTGNMAASAFSGLIAAPVFSGLGGARGLAGWQWLFIIQGSLSIVVAIAGFFLLPDAPLKTRWLTPEERQLAHDRVAKDTTERLEGGSSVMKGLREALVDWRTYMFCLADLLHLAANGFKNFLPSVTKGITPDTTTALVLTCPPYVLAAFLSVIVSWSSGRFNERTWHITISKALAIAGFAIGMGTMNTGARYFGIMLFVGATYGVNNIILGWTSSVLGQTDEKKAVAIAMANTFGNLSSVFTPYLWKDDDFPRYVKAMSASIGFSVGVIICAWILRIALMRVNKKMRRDDPSASNFYVY
ncbi:putative MFS transporter [Hypomontagnella monticulosa]|nr:putative MFS transporter [Hypomontagnella monticulosa]